MNADEIREKAMILGTELASRIRAFEEETGAFVEDLREERLEELSDKPKGPVYNVKVGIRIL